MLTDERQEATKSIRQWKIIAAVVTVAVAGVIGALTWYLTRPVPEEVSLQSAVEVVDTGAASLGDDLEGTSTAEVPV